MRMLNTAKQFVDQVVLPARAEFENYNYDLVKDTVRQASEMGLASVSIPRQYGGLGGTVLEEVQVVKEMAGVSGSFDTGFIVQAGIGTRPIVLFGNDTQKSDYVPRIAKGELFGSFALTEPNAGSDINNATTTAVREGDGYYINGTKTFISNAGWADFFVVFAKIEEDEKLSAFIVDKDDTIELGPEFKKMGIRASSTRTVKFNMTFVDKSKLLGKRGDGFKIAMATLNLGRLKLSAAVLSAGRRAINYATEYADSREQFGRSVLFYPIIQKKISDANRELNKLEEAIDKTANAIDVAIQSGASKVDVLKDFAGETAILKVRSSETSSRAIDEAMQIMAGQGFMDSHPIEAMYRDARITRIYEGTNEVCRLQALRYMSKLPKMDQLALKLLYGRSLAKAKKGPTNIPVRVFKLADKLIEDYIG